MFKRLLGLWLAIGMLLSAPVLAQVGWAPLSPGDGGFSLQMPQGAKRTEDKLASGPGSPGTSVVYSGFSGGDFYLVGWVDYAPDFVFNDEGELLANQDNFVKGIKARLTSSRQIRMGSYPGLEFTAVQDGVNVSHGRIFIVGKRPYMIIAVVAPERANDPAIVQFLDSFKLNP